MANLRFRAFATNPDLAVTWANTDGTPNIYITEDPDFNTVTLGVTNNLGTPVTLPSGTPVAWGQLPAGQSAVYLFFQGLLPNEVIAASMIQADGWSSATFVDPQTELQYLVAAPDAEVTFAADAPLSFTVSGLASDVRPTSGTLVVSFAGAAGLPAALANPQVFVQIASPPDGSRKALDLDIGFAGTETVFTGGVDNSLLLYLTNPNAEPIAPVSNWEAEPPTFKLLFVYGAEPGALTTLAQSQSISVTIQNAYGNSWRPVRKLNQGANPYWEMQPSPAGKRPALGIGANATIAFLIEGISIPAGARGLTFAYLSYNNVPGFLDGFAALTVVKVDPITATIVATPASVNTAIAVAPVTLAITADNATYVSIAGTGYAKPTLSETFSDSVSVTASDTTTFTLVASNSVTGEQVAQSATVTVSPDTFHRVPTGAIMIWSGAPSAIPAGWALCDGTHGTPDLVSRFIYGAGATGIAPGTTGGTTSHTHNASAAVTIVSAGGHTHGVPSAWYANTASSGSGRTIVDRNSGSPPWNTTTAGTHTHGATATATVQSNSNMPPWYALCFIMKLD